MGSFPKGMRCLLVDGDGANDGVDASLRSPELDYSVTAVNSLEAAQACFAGGAVAYDCVLLEHSLLAGVPAGAAAAFFKQAAAVHAPVVLMAASPTQAAVMEGVHLGAVDFLERPLSFHKLRNLWTHKIRRMMQAANGGVIPRPPSCPQLAMGRTNSGELNTGKPAAAPAVSAMQRSGSQPVFSCPATPSLLTIAAPQPQESSSLASGDDSMQMADVVPPASTVGAAADRSDATSRVVQQPVEAAMATPAATGLPAPGAFSAPAATQPVLPAAPLACLRLGASDDLLPSVVHWPHLPAGTTWGTPVSCSVPPPIPGSPGAGADQRCASDVAIPNLAIQWCPRGSLPVPASTYDLLLPEDFSLARAMAEVPPAAAPACGNNSKPAGPLGLRLTVTPSLLADINASLGPHHRQQPVTTAASLSPQLAPTFAS